MLQNCTTHRGLGTPTSIRHQENAPKDNVPNIEANPHLRLLEITQDCVKLTAEKLSRKAGIHACVRTVCTCVS